MAERIESAQSLAKRIEKEWRSVFHWGDGAADASRCSVAAIHARDLAVVRAVRAHYGMPPGADFDERVLAAITEPTDE